MAAWPYWLHMYGINLLFFFTKKVCILINYLYTGSSDEQADPTKYSDKFKVIDALVIITYKSCGPLFICYVLKYIHV